MKLKAFSSDPYGRAVLAGEVLTISSLCDEIPTGSKGFVLLVAFDTTRSNGTELVDAAADILRRGATYVCCWGPDCERLHDAFDEADRAVSGEARDDHLLMTTWHEKETLQEAIWFALNCAVPAEAYRDTTRSVIVVAVGNPAWAADVTDYLHAGAPMHNEA